MKMEKVRFYLIDDHVLFREGLCGLITMDDRFEVIGEANNGRKALQDLSKKKPDIIFLDISMPELNGLNTITPLKKLLPYSKIIIISMFDKSRYICDALTLGVDGYLLKDIGTNELYKAIDTVLSGKRYLSEKINQMIIQDYVGVIKECKISSPIETLSGREKEVFQLLIEGNTGKEIADKLNISYKTVEHHRSKLMKKLSCNTLAQLIHLAAKEDLL